MSNPILGVDFSGAVQAGEKIWVSRATLQNGILTFDFLSRASQLPGGTSDRADALIALRTWISAQQGAVCGLDFPFSLAGAEITDPNYQTWLENFTGRFEDADVFKSSSAGARRRTDIEAKTPFSPLNLRLYRQTFHGIRDVLAPLHLAGAQILPFDTATSGHIHLLEICPASLLKREKLYLSYKGKSEAQRQNRATIAGELAARTPFAWTPELENLALGDSEGDALDAVLAAICVYNALKKADFSARDNLERLEGKVYF